LIFISNSRYLQYFPPNVGNGFHSPDSRGKRAKQNQVILPEAAATNGSRELNVQNTWFWCVLAANGGISCKKKMLY
jgi:hypothetical protein